LQSKSGLTFVHNCGRLGDVLLDYTKNFYIAQKYGLDLYIHDGIPYLQEFVLSEKTPRLNIEDTALRAGRLPSAPTFNRLVTINNDAHISQHDPNTLYKTECYFTVDGISDFNQFHRHMFKCSIEQPSFGNEVAELLAPKKTFAFQLPTDVITVAMHMRKGGGYDKPLSSELYRPINPTQGNGKRTCRYAYVDRNEPYKFPPEQYYLDQLIFLHTILDGQPLYVHLFTDDQNPQDIAARIQAKLQQANITNVFINYRKNINRHDMNIIEDIYAISKFDYLIKSESHYPWIAQMIGKHKAIFSPISFVWRGDFLDFNVTEIAIPDRVNHILHQISVTQKNMTLIKELLTQVSRA
jgi:hypothetical protein